jgi:hypothetical protein
MLSNDAPDRGSGILELEVDELPTWPLQLVRGGPTTESFVFSDEVSRYLQICADALDFKNKIFIIQWNILQQDFVDSPESWGHFSVSISGEQSGVHIEAIFERPFCSKQSANPSSDEHA